MTAVQTAAVIDHPVTSYGVRLPLFDTQRAGKVVDKPLGTIDKVTTDVQSSRAVSEYLTSLQVT